MIGLIGEAFGLHEGWEFLDDLNKCRVLKAKVYYVVCAWSVSQLCGQSVSLLISQPVCSESTVGADSRISEYSRQTVKRIFQLCSCTLYGRLIFKRCISQTR
jgi:hypothetical protein